MATGGGSRWHRQFTLFLHRRGRPQHRSGEGSRREREGRENVCRREGVNRAKALCIPPTVSDPSPLSPASMRLSSKTSWPLSWRAIGRTRHERVGFAENLGTRIDFGGGQTAERNTAVRSATLG